MLVKRWRLETSDDNDTSTRAKDSVLSSWSSQSAFTDIDVQVRPELNLEFLRIFENFFCLIESVE